MCRFEPLLDAMNDAVLQSRGGEVAPDFPGGGGVIPKVEVLWSSLEYGGGDDKDDDGDGLIDNVDEVYTQHKRPFTFVHLEIHKSITGESTTTLEIRLKSP